MTYTGTYQPQRDTPEDEEIRQENIERMRPDIPESMQQGQAPSTEEIQQQVTGADLMQQYGITNESVAAGMDGTERWLEDNIYVPLGARLRGRSEEEERAWRLQQMGLGQARNQAHADYIDQAGGATGAAREVTRAVLGGGQDAIKSLGEFADLSGDSLKVGLNKLLGKPTDGSQDPWSEEYQRGNWINIPYSVKENKTGWGKLARGLVEFGLLTRWTGGVTKTVGGVTGVTRTANAAIAGNKYISFVAKGAKISLDGGAADLISTSSEMGNIANLLEEHTPWLMPEFMSYLAVRPEDNPWEARIKTVAAGAGMNHIGHFLGAIGKGAWRSIDDFKAGKTLAEANENGNKVFRQEMAEELQKAEVNATEGAANRLAEGRGISRADPRDEFLREYLSEEDYARYTDPNTSAADRAALDALADKGGKAFDDEFDWVEYRSTKQAADNATRQPDPLVNPETSTNTERATYRKPDNASQRATAEAILDTKRGGDGKIYTSVASEPTIRNIALGNQNLRQIVQEVTDDITNSVFHQKQLSAALPKGMSYEDFQTAAYKIAEPLLSQLDDVINGKKINLAATYKKILKNPQDKRLYHEIDGKIVAGIGPVQKSANIIVLRSLARTVSDMATSGLSISDTLSTVSYTHLTLPTSDLV